MGFAEYEEFDGVGLAELIRRRAVSVHEVLEAAIGRIETAEPALGAVVHRQFDDALARVEGNGLAGPFAGVPFLVKDLGAFERGQPCTNGSRLFRRFVPDHDCAMVERYRAAGLVTLGRTNTPELGLSITTEPVAHGPCRNPWNPERSAGGSSGGAAAAVAAGLVPLAHASDAAGSIRIPAAFCGLVGLKPSRGRTTHAPDQGEGVGGLAVTHALTRTVRDCAALLDATAGPAPGDPYFAPPPARPFLREVGADPGRLRIALVVHGPGGEPVEPACGDATRAAAELCAALGHDVVELPLEVDPERLRRASQVLFGAGAANLLRLAADLLGRPPEPDELEPLTLGFAELGRRASAADFQLAMHVVHAAGRRIASLEAFDVLITPTTARAAPPLGTVGADTIDPERFTREVEAIAPFPILFNMSGQPAISLPLGTTPDALPLGVQFAARYADEATLFRLAAQLEEAAPWPGRISRAVRREPSAAA